MKTLKIFLLFVVITSSLSIQAQVKKKPVKMALPKVQHFCSTIMPEKQGVSKDTSNTRAMADNYYLWDNGKVLNVKFLGNGGSQKIREKVKKAAKEWEKYANLTFNFIEDGDAQIRVLLTNTGGCNSTVGTVALMRNADEKTMNIDTNFFYYRNEFYDILLSQTIQHEFGHAIGLLHEHSYKNQIQWNKEVVYKDALQTNGWDKKQVDFQIFEQYEALYTNGFGYDKLSIMHYGFPARWTLNNVEIKPNYYISEMDKATVKMLYPKETSSRPNEFPRFVISNYTYPTKVINSTQRKGLLIYPSFNLTTAGRTGTLVLIAYLIGPDGKAVISRSNSEKIVADVKGGDLKPGTKLNVNKFATDFEMFIPYSEFGELKNYKILFVIKMMDQVNNVDKYLVIDNVEYSQIKNQQN